MTDQPEPRYQVTVERTSAGTFVARNRRGGQVRFSTGEDGDFAPVENRISPPRRLRATKVPAEVRSTVTWYRGSAFSVIVLLRVDVATT